MPTKSVRELVSFGSNIGASRDAKQNIQLSCRTEHGCTNQHSEKQE